MDVSPKNMKEKLSVLTPFCVEQLWCSHCLMLALIHVEPKKSFSLSLLLADLPKSERTQSDLIRSDCESCQG
jgi:hypothetical protein